MRKAPERDRGDEHHDTGIGRYAAKLKITRMPPACPGDGYAPCYNNGPLRSSFPLTGGFAAGEWERGWGMGKVALDVATSVRLPRASRGHPPRLVRAKQATQETVEPCQFSPAELAAYGGSYS